MDRDYRELFFGESQEYLSQINTFLVSLEKDPSNQEALNEIFRLMHTLKGMAATMGFGDLAEFSHKIEDIFDNLRSGAQKLTSQIMDVVFSCIDTIGVLLDELHDNRESSVDIKSYMDKLEKILSGADLKTTEEEKGVKQKYHQTEENFQLSPYEKKLFDRKQEEGFDMVKITIELVKDCVMKEARAILVIIRLRQIGEVVKLVPSEEALKRGEFDNIFSIVLATKEDSRIVKDELTRVLEIEKVDVDPFDPSNQDADGQKTAPTYLKKIQSMRIRVERLDKIMNFMGELSIAKSRLVQTLQTRDFETFSEITFIIERLVTSLQDEILQMRLLPISYILDAFPRIVRDLVRELDKDIDLEIKGSEIELDRIILDELGDPLIHLLRNAVDHGI
ncbi:MAG: Hpt domain-containing protein, partial [Candidatus Omnitrophota bacterium]